MIKIPREQSLAQTKIALKELKNPLMLFPSIKVYGWSTTWTTYNYTLASASASSVFLFLLNGICLPPTSTFLLLNFSIFSRFTI